MIHKRARLYFFAKRQGSRIDHPASTSAQSKTCGADLGSTDYMQRDQLRIFADGVGEAWRLADCLSQGGRRCSNRATKPSGDHHEAERLRRCLRRGSWDATYSYYRRLCSRDVVSAERKMQKPRLHSTLLDEWTGFERGRLISRRARLTATAQLSYPGLYTG